MKKIPEDYAAENEDLSVQSGGILICKYCRNEINLKSKPSDRIREHLASKRHKRISAWRVSHLLLNHCLQLGKESKNLKMLLTSLLGLFVIVAYPFLLWMVQWLRLWSVTARTMPGVDALAGRSSFSYSHWSDKSKSWWWACNSTNLPSWWVGHVWTHCFHSTIKKRGTSLCCWLTVHSWVCVMLLVCSCI